MSDVRWTDSKYKGKTYLPLSSAVDKVVTAKGEKDEQKILTGTWSAHTNLSQNSYRDSSSSRNREGRDGREGYGNRYESDTYNHHNNYTSNYDDKHSGHVRESNAYPYPHPSPYSEYRARTGSTGSLSHSPSQSKYGYDSDIHTYKSPFRDLKGRDEST